MGLDIHNFDRQFDLALRHVMESAISERNKALIRQFCDACLLRQVCGKVRLIRTLCVLGQFAHQLGKDFDQATREDLERLVGGLLQHTPTYSVETISTSKRILRRFMTYVVAPNEFPHVKPVPPLVAWITTHIPRRDRPRVKRADLLTPEDVDKLLRAASCERDRAMVAVLWEAGPRIAELGNRCIKDVTPTTNGYTIDLTGKTGSRSPLVVSSAPHLAAWLAIHPQRDRHDAPLWVQRRSAAAVTYATISVMLERLFHRAGITKPFHPHIFRHSRVTYVLANGIMNEQQCRTYFGWTPDSDMPGSTYAHLLDTDVNNAILRENNLAPHQELHRELQPRKCTICGTLNPARSEYCQRCTAVLDLKRAYEHQQLHDMKETLFASMFQVMVERGLVDEAARAVHDAGLGHVLKRLAGMVKDDQISPEEQK